MVQPQRAIVAAASTEVFRGMGRNPFRDQRMESEADRPDPGTNLDGLKVESIVLVVKIESNPRTAAGACLPNGFGV
jgi:hypothetical protein